MVILKGSGPKGRILKEDLHAFVSQRLNGGSSKVGFQHSQPDIAFSKWGSISFEKLSKFQKTASKNLHTSWINIPHVTQHDDADITDLLALRADLNKEHKTKVSPLAYYFMLFAQIPPKTGCEFWAVNYLRLRANSHFYLKL